MKKYLLLSIAFLTLTAPMEAAYTVRKGRFVNVEEVATLPVEEHFQEGMQALNRKDWHEAARQFTIITVNFPGYEGYGDAAFYLGVSNYRLEEYDFANEAFTKCLNAANPSAYYQEALEYKFLIAEQFKSGARRRPWGTKMLPKWASGYELSLEIYDEITHTLPCHDLAARAFFSKACLQWSQKDFRGSISSFETLIARFPKHELTPEAYRQIARVYHDQSKFEFQNPDILAFAQINQRRFERDFPRDARLLDSAENVEAIKELYANGMYETAEFYERTHKHQASTIYYQNTIRQFPDTRVANKCRHRLMRLHPQLLEALEEELAHQAQEQNEETFDHS